MRVFLHLRIRLSAVIVCSGSENMMSIQPKTIDFNGSRWIAISEYVRKAADVRRLTKKADSLTSRCKELESRLNDWENPSRGSASSVQRGLARKQEAHENLKQRFDETKQQLKTIKEKLRGTQSKYTEEVKLRLEKEREIEKGVTNYLKG